MAGANSLIWMNAQGKLTGFDVCPDQTHLLHGALKLCFKYNFCIGCASPVLVSDVCLGPQPAPPPLHATAKWLAFIIHIGHSLHITTVYHLVGAMEFAHCCVILHSKGD